MTAKRLATALAALILSLLLSSRAFATSQYPDRIILEGKNRALHLNPLEQWFAAGNERPEILEEGLISTALWRGYVATWEVFDGKLYLVEVKQEVFKPSPDTADRNSFRDTEWRAIPLGEFFPSNMIAEIENRPLLPEPKEEGAEGEAKQESEPKEPSPATKPAVLATWYSGTLRLPEGQMLRYVHQGYASRYEFEIHIEVKDGVVVRQEKIDNRESPDLDDQNAGMREVDNYTPGGGIDPDLARRLEEEKAASDAAENANDEAAPSSENGASAPEETPAPAEKK